MVAVLLQLYKMASSPNTLPGGRILRNLLSRDTSTFPSEKKRINEISQVKVDQNGRKGFPLLGVV